jgi:signal transduction histidine kinase
LAEKSSLTYQVLNNLVSNAIKFSDPGSMIKLTISEENNSIFVQIKDAGVGIPADLLGSIFDPKKQTTRDGTQGEKGTGFGMPIVRSYIERFGAHIQVESKTKQESSQDHGTTVTLKFEKAA